MPEETQNPSQIIANAPGPIGQQPVIIPRDTSVNTSKPEYDDIGAFGLSLRGYLTVILVATVCIEELLGKTPGTTTVAMALVTLGFYFKGNK